MKLVDVSNYQPIPSPADCDALKAFGVTGAIIGLQQPAHGDEQADAFRANGITVEDCYLENTANPAIPAGMKRGWVAVETGSGFNDEAAIDAQLAYLAAQGLAGGLYTSRSMIAQFGLTEAVAGKYANVQLWLADYDHDDTTLPAGAWMKQYAGGEIPVPGLGYQIDLNYREDAPVPDANHADNYDIGLERLQLEAMLRVIRDEHKRAGGDPQVLIDIVNGTR